MLVSDKNSYFFILQPVSYQLLIVKKEEADKAYEALATIVETTNMNPDVLLRDVRFQKRKIVSVIDSTAEGKTFLISLLKSLGGNDNEKVMVSERLSLGRQISRRRKSLNKKLIKYQWELLKTPLDDKARIVSFALFLKQELKDILSCLKTTKHETEAIILSILMDELNMVKQEVFQWLKNNLEEKRGG